MGTYFSVCGSLVQYKGQLVRRCDPDYLFQGNIQQEVIYSGVLIFILCIFLWVVFILFKKILRRRYTKDILKMRDIFSLCLATLLLFGILVYWLFKILRLGGVV